MKLFTLVVTLTTLAFAADAPTTRALTDLEQAKLENYLLKTQAARKALEEIQDAGVAYMVDICKSVGADQRTCDLDIVKKTVSKKTPEDSAKKQ